MRYIFLLSLICALTCSCQPKTAQVSQWRGPERNGIYPEKGLLKSWPEQGPDMIWSVDGLGEGHGSVSFSRDKIFVLGMQDTTGVIYAFNFDGKPVWQKKYGTEWYESYSGTRSTPTVIDDLVYFMSGQGVIYCLEEKTGRQVWAVDALKTFDAENIQWGMAESLLIDGDQIICTPGGKEHNVVSLNRFTGKTNWTTPALGQSAAYCSPVLIDHHGTRLFITMTSDAIIAVSPENGRMYWNFPQKQRNKIHSNTPVYHNSRVYCSSENADSDNGLVSILLSEDGKSAKIEWRNRNYTNLMGGIVMKDNLIFGSEYRKRGWVVTNAQNGEVQYSSEAISPGAVIWADDRFYCYTESGKMVLIDAGSDHIDVVGEFNVTLGTNQHWAHPVIHNKRLYIRHGDALIAYNIEDK